MLLRDNWRLNFVIDMIFRESNFSLWMVSSMRNRIWRNFLFYLVSIFMSDMRHLWGIRGGKVLQHLTYMDIYKNQKLYLKRNIKSYVRFCIVRNPYDRMISCYHFLGEGMRFGEFIDWVYMELDGYYRLKRDPFVVILPQWEFVTNENGENGMNEILRFENLKSDFRVFKRKYNIRCKSLPHINKRTRMTDDISAYFTRQLEEKVYHMYYWDFKMFGYKRYNFN